VNVSSSSIIQAAATYQTTQASMSSFAPHLSLRAYESSHVSSDMTSAWTVSQGGRGSPFVTSTDGTKTSLSGASAPKAINASTLLMATPGGDFLRGGATELMAGTTGFKPRSRLADEFTSALIQDLRFHRPVSRYAHESNDVARCQFPIQFHERSGMSFTALRSTNLSLPLNNWTALGTVVDDPRANSSLPTHRRQLKARVLPRSFA